MNNPALTKSTITLALFALMATELHAMAPRDVEDLVGARASSGESKLEDRGYHHRKTIKMSNSSIAYWWNPRKQACIAVTTADGRYKSIMTQPEAVCDGEDRSSDGHHGRGHPGGYGKPAPQVMKVDDGNVAVDLGGCTVLFNPHGNVVNQGASCSRGDMREARTAFDAYQREQNAPAHAEAPPGGFGSPNAGATVTCESNHGQYQFCRHSIGANAQVRVHRRLSSTRCRQGQSWGYDHDGVWVNNGCRAVFEIR